MTKQQALERLTAIEKEVKELRKIVEQPEQQKSKEQRFWELMLQNVSLKVDKEEYPNSTFGFVGDEFVWEYNAETGHLWLSWEKIWRVFEDEYNMNYNDIESFVKNQVEEHFKCKVVTPGTGITLYTGLVEEHFKSLK